MKIGVDSRPLANEITGVSRYVSESLKCLLNFEDNNKFFLYSPAKFAHDNLNSKKTTIKFKNYKDKYRRFIWSQTLLPYWALKDEIDIFWSPSHRLPKFLPRKTARVVTIHDLVWKHASKTMTSQRRIMDSLMMPEAVKSADIVVSVSQNTAIDLKNAFPDQVHKIRVIYPGLTILPEKNLTHIKNFYIKMPYILFVGTIEPRKNLERLIKAFSKIKDKKIKLVIAGQRGWGNVDLEKYINQFSLKNRVSLLGRVSNEQLSVLYKNCLFLAMPSLYEGFGLPIIEAMSFGKTVLTSNVSSLPEITNEAGILINPLDESAITNGLNLLLDEKVNQNFAKKAKINAQNFTWLNCSKNLLEIFDEAIKIRIEKC